MGKYTFTWEHSANEVFVTGTFDDWRKTVKLEKEDSIFKKTVELPKTHTQYKVRSRPSHSIGCPVCANFANTSPAVRCKW